MHVLPFFIKNTPAEPLQYLWFLTWMITFRLILTQRFVHWTISNNIIKWFSLSEIEAASFLVMVEALDKRRIQLYATMRLPIEDGKIMLYHDLKQGSCLMHWLQCPISWEHKKRLHTVTDLRDSMRGLQEDMQELKEDRKTLIRNINMLACTSKEMPEDG